MSGPQHPNEVQPPEVLARRAVLERLPDAAFERLAQLAARRFGVAGALISVQGQERPWVEVNCADDAGPQGGGQVQHTGGRRGDVLPDSAPSGGAAPGARGAEMPDLRLDAYRAGHLPPDMGFFAAAPLRTAGGETVGWLCLWDRRALPPLDVSERADLADLAALVMDRLEGQAQALVLERQQDASAAYTRDLRAALTLSQTLQAISDLSDLDLEPAELLLRSVELTGAALQVDWGGLAAVYARHAVQVSAWHTPDASEFARRAARSVQRTDGGLLWEACAQRGILYIDDYAQHPGAHPGLLAAGARSVTSAYLGGHDDTSYVMTVVRLNRQQDWSANDRALFTAVVRAVRQALTRSALHNSLLQMKEKLSLTLNAAPLILWTTDMDGTFTVSEGRGLTDVGLAAGAAVGQNVREVYAAAPQVIANVMRALAGERFVTTVEVGERVFEASYAPLLDADGRQLGAMGVGYDVTSRVQSEDEERRARTQAEALVQLSHVLDADADASQVADHALETLERALGQGQLLLLQKQGENFLPVSWRNQASPSLYRHQHIGIDSAQLRALGVLDGQAAYPDVDDLPEGMLADGISGVALLPVLLDVPEAEQVLVAYRSGPAAPWTLQERALLGAASRSLSAWARRHIQQQELQSAANTDALTGLGNRRAFEHDLERVLAVAGLDAQELAVLSLDLDGLKSINDTQGHARGDALLLTFGRALRLHFPPQDRVYRLGGDEYVMLLSGAGPQDEALVLGRIEQAVQSTRHAGFALSGASAGLAYFPHEGSGEALVRLSDTRMYSAKGERRKVGR